MNKLFISSLVSLFIFYVLSLTLSFGTAFAIFCLTIVLMGGASFLEVGRETKRIKHLRLIK